MRYHTSSLHLLVDTEGKKPEENEGWDQWDGGGSAQHRSLPYSYSQWFIPFCFYKHML